jgi:hypothetical protein
MKELDFTEEIAWCCEYCEANTNPVEQCSSLLKGREEQRTSTTTLLGSDSQGWNKRGCKENPGIKVNGKRKEEKAHHLGNKEEHATMGKRELLLKGDGSCNNKLDIAEEKSSVGEAACEEIQGNNAKTDRVPIDKNSPIEKRKFSSCCAEREYMRNDRTFTEAKAGQPEQNISLVTAGLAANTAILLDARNMSRHIQTQETEHQCTVLGRSMEHRSLVDKPSVVQNSLDLASRETIKSTTPGLFPINEKDKSTSTGDIQLNRTNSAISADVVAECGRNKPSKSDKNARSGDSQIDGMIERLSLNQPKPLATVKSVSRPWNARTLPDPRINRANSSAQSLPLHMVQRNTEQENRDPRFYRFDNGSLPDTVHRISHDGRFTKRRWVVGPDTESHDRRNGLRGNSTDLFYRQGCEPKIHNFGYVPAQSLFDFVWQYVFTSIVILIRCSLN